MKRILLMAAAFSLTAGAALAATPSNAPATPPAVPHHAHATMASSNRQADRETQALNLLEAKGYSGFTNFRPAGKDFAASVTQNGHTANLRVDPQSGQITTVG